MQKYALILAGGTGSRAGGDLPKQFQTIAGKRMVWWSREAFLKADPSFIVIFVVHPDFISLLKDDERADVMITEGGMSRIESVRKGLKYMETLPDFNKESLVFIHDAARPCLSSDIINRGAGSVRPGVGGVPVVPLSDSIRRLSADGSKAVDRKDYVAVQTPQVFLYSDIRRAYDRLGKESGFTDDASVAENIGLSVMTYRGEPYNIKITHPGDFYFAEQYLKNISN